MIAWLSDRSRTQQFSPRLAGAFVNPPGGRLLTRSARINRLLIALLCGPLSLLGLLSAALLPKNSALFLDQLVLAEAAP